MCKKIWVNDTHKFAVFHFIFASIIAHPKGFDLCPFYYMSAAADHSLLCLSSSGKFKEQADRNPKGHTSKALAHEMMSLWAAPGRGVAHQKLK